MRTPREIYAQYRIMPSLQLHQLRVAAVAKLICDHATTPVNTQDVLLECLFHDIGNIVKFDLAYFPEFVQPEGSAYWESVKADFVKKYGNEQHAANAAIAREIGLSEHIVGMMDMSGFSHIGTIIERGPIELKICQYADLRVGPHGIVSLEERLRDFEKRYSAKNDSAYESAAHTGRELEEQVFSRTTIRPEDINDARVTPLIGELREYSPT
ncbi:MAG: HD domain-containing protein [Patescibacteria group bacterium]